MGKTFSPTDPKALSIVITPSQEYHRVACVRPAKLHKGLDAQVNAFLGKLKRRGSFLSAIESEAEQVVALEPAMKDLADNPLHERIMEFRERVRRKGKVEDEIMVPALAAVREAARRQLGLHPFKVQIMGAIALQRGFLTEMATGEGKTLTAGLAATLWGWTKRPCHIVTVNDYLAARDADWLKQLYHFCGVRVGAVTSKLDPGDRRRGYGSDVTYTTSKEVLADFLRDRLQLGGMDQPTRRLIRQMLSPQQAAQSNLVMRGVDIGLIDEADSVLIDEAVTPLIISTPHKNPFFSEASHTAHQLVEQLDAESDYKINARYKEIEITDEGSLKLAGLCATKAGIWRGSDRRTDLIRQALIAREFFHRGKQYVIDQDKIVIVDEFTGRPMPQRSWRQGLHQAIEAKEGVPISDPTETIARLSFQRYFRLYRQLAGMTGTASEASGEFWQIYRLPVIRIPTNKPCVRIQGPDQVFLSDTEKWDKIAEEVVQIHETGRPILVGTRSVAASERLGKLLEGRITHFKILNAIRHQEEAQVVSDAGQRGRVTIATNMAGRGTDIRLEPGVAALGGLHVIATERHESGRVDRQLFGRAARQGDPGTAQAFVSLEDELFQRHLPPSVQKPVRAAFQRGVPGCRPAVHSAYRIAQRNAQAQAFKQRKNVLKMDDWLDEALSFAGMPLA
jgi:preprotein translocase subunit SecA